MQQKTKTIAGAIFSVIIIAALFGIYSVYHKNKQAQQNQPQPALAAQQPTVTTSDSQSDSTVSIEGVVVSLQKNILDIKNGDAENKLSLVDQPSFFEMVGGKEVLKKATDFPKGTKIKAFVRQRDTMVTAVEILN